MRPNSGLFHRLLVAVTVPLGLLFGFPAGIREARTGEADPIDPTTRFERSDVNAKAVFLTGAGLLIVLWLFVLITYPIFAWLEHVNAEESPPAPRALQRTSIPPGPRLQANPREDLRDLQAREAKELSGYGWVDRAHGVVSIPIDNAIRIVAAHGIPPQPAPANQTYFDPRAGTRQTGFEGKVEPEAR